MLLFVKGSKAFSLHFPDGCQGIDRLTKPLQSAIIEHEHTGKDDTMKLMHLADLHLGVSLHRYSLQAEQTEMLQSLCRIAGEEKPDAILIAGDVYDRSIPPVYATQMLDTFLAALSRIARVFVISGNHDSAERLAFLSEPLERGGLYISPVYQGTVTPVTLADAEGPVDIWLLPYLKPAYVRPWFPGETLENTNEALRCALAHLKLDPSRRNVLVAHQFVSGGKVSESAMAQLATADVYVGGIDMVDAHLFASFDYVALGHLHQAQNVGSERIRYCGTPMAYDFYEASAVKSVTMVELAGDRSLSIREIPIPQPRPLVEVRGSFDEVTSTEAIRQADRNAYTHVTLTDDQPVPDVLNRLRQVYPYLTHLDWDNARTRHEADFSAAADVKKHTPASLFSEFFQTMNHADMTPEQSDYVDQLIREIWEDKA